MRPNSNSFLSCFRFGASVDYVTISTPGKVPLPSLKGGPEWGVAAHYRTLTIHNLASGDVPLLSAVLPRAEILAIEVAVDLRPNSEVPAAERAKLLDDAHSFMVRHLYPYDAPHMNEAKTLAYTPELSKTLPFNYKMPLPTAQLLYGLRDDGPAQVKVYRKGRDNGAALDQRDHSTRVEVKLKREMCRELGIETIEDLVGFSFRTKLAAYFRMARAAVPTKRRTQRPVIAVVEDRKADNALDLVRAAWEPAGTGVQALLEIPNLRFQRHVEANQRIGTALQLLQRRFAACNEKVSDAVQAAEKYLVESAACDWMEGSPITFKNGPLLPASASTAPTADPIDALEEEVQ